MSKLNDPPGSPPGTEIDPFEAVYNRVGEDSGDNGMCDVDASIAWRIGLAAFLEARRAGARFPHDSILGGDHDELSDETCDPPHGRS